MNIDQMAPSKSEFLAKEDVSEQGRNLTIFGFSQRTVKGDNGDENKWVIEWAEKMKPLILNKTNVNRLKAVLRTSNTEEMISKVVNVYNDPYVEFGGKTVGGVRIREAQANGAAQSAADIAPASPQPLPDTAGGGFSDDIPFGPRVDF